MEEFRQREQETFTPVPPFQQQRTNGKSIAALVLGILSIILPYVGLILGIIAIVFASLSKKEIQRSGEQGRGLAVAGLVCGIIGTAIYAVIIIILIIVFAVLGAATDGFTPTFSTNV